MAQETVFHKIVSGELPCDNVYETDDVLGFKDIHPKAPLHILFVAKRQKDFVASIADITKETAHVPAMLIHAAREFAIQKGIDGYKLLFNVGKGGGQEVPYLHVHLLSQTKIN